MVSTHAYEAWGPGFKPHWTRALNTAQFTIKKSVFNHQRTNYMSSVVYNKDLTPKFKCFDQIINLMFNENIWF